MGERHEAEGGRVTTRYLLGRLCLAFGASFFVTSLAMGPWFGVGRYVPDGAGLVEIPCWVVAMTGTGLALMILGVWLRGNIGAS